MALLRNSVAQIIKAHEGGFAVPTADNDEIAKKLPDILKEEAEIAHGKNIAGVNVTIGGKPVSIDLQLAFPKSSSALTPASQEEYYDLIKKLLAEGQAYEKKAGIYAFPLVPLRVLTKNDEGGNETENEIEPNSVLIFDGAAYSKEEAQSFHRFIFTNYGQLTSDMEALDSAVFKAINDKKLLLHVKASGYGIWTMSPKNFGNDYEYDEASKMYKVKEGTTRLCMDLDKDVGVPWKWSSSFDIRKGGTFVARTEQLKDIAAAIADVEAGRKTIAEAFFEKDPKTGELRTKFDTYGMHPGFRTANYDPAPRPLPPDVKAAIDPVARICQSAKLAQ